MASKEDFQIKSDSPVADDLMFWRVVGHEALSRPSCYELTVLSKNRKIDAKDILGRAFDVVIEFQDANGNTHERHCQGHSIRFTHSGQVGRHYRYEISLQSWFGLLSKRTNSRIHQDKPVLEVFNSVLEDSAIKRVKKTETKHVGDTHTKRPYCVQHQESDYQFLSRLLEDEGIYYWFDAHYAPGTMNLSDNSARQNMLPVTDTLRYVPSGVNDARYNEITQWVSTRQFDTGSFSSSDSDFEAIRTKLTADTSSLDNHELDDLGVFFEFAGGYSKDDDTDKIAFRRMDEIITRRERHWAQTSWPDVTAGKSFTFENDPDGTRDGDYLIAACSFVVSHPGYEGISLKEEPRSITVVLKNALETDAVNSAAQVAYTGLINSSSALRTGVPGTRAFMLTVVPLDITYVVPRLTPKVTMPGPQSAIVVGPAGDEICADDLGRVKVHFHWDRYDKSDKNSSCWVRVSQPWAGKGWGGYFIPRIGQEVIVDFLNGDPDRPIIVGRVYNDDQPKPFDSHTQSGFRTRSTPKGSAANCNEFRFDDKKGSEQVYLHAEKNQDISVENDETHTVGHDRIKTIDHDETNHIKNDRKETVGKNETINIGADRNESVGANETIEIGTNRTEKVGANEKIDIGANRDETVGGNESVAVAANQDIKVGANQKVMVGASRTDTVGANVTQMIGGSLSQTVAGGVTINTPGKMTVTALGGVTFIAPGGTKFVDSTFDYIGGAIKSVYGKELTLYSLKTELTGIAITVRAINVNKVGLLNEKADAKFTKAGIKLAKSDSAYIHKAGVAVINASSTLFT